MRNLNDSTFYMHVAVCTILVIVFILALRPWKVPGKQYDEKYDRIADEIIRCIKQSRTHEELKLYEDEADNFYMNNYEFLGHDKSIEIYQRMTSAAIRKVTQLNRDRISS